MCIIWVQVCVLCSWSNSTAVKFVPLVDRPHAGSCDDCTTCIWRYSIYSMCLRECRVCLFPNTTCVQIQKSSAMLQMCRPSNRSTSECVMLVMPSSTHTLRSGGNLGRGAILKLCCSGTCRGLRLSCDMWLVCPCWFRRSTRLDHLFPLRVPQCLNLLTIFGRNKKIA